jgi:glycosyltransferase involved in cell wall biosynthesis
MMTSRKLSDPDQSDHPPSVMSENWLSTNMEIIYTKNPESQEWIRKNWKNTQKKIKSRTMIENPKIAIICDWLIDFGWAELVISHLLELYPSADIYTSVCYMDHPMLKWRNVYTSWLQRVPFFNRHHKLAGIIRPFAFRSFDLSRYDVVICSSSAESKQVAMGKWNRSRHPEWNEGSRSKSRETLDSEINSEWQEQGTSLPPTSYLLPPIFCYCHTPTRYYWSHAQEYEDMMEFWWMNPLVKLTFRLLKWWMQRLDYEAAQRVDFFIANSKTTQERIQKYYNRESEVIYPGIEIRKSEEIGDRSELKNSPYYLGLGRCIPYKRFDILVDTFNANGKNLILCTSTDTPLFRELKAKSKPNIEWRYRISEEEKNTLMANAKAFLFPPEEDFGLVPIEAMAMGTPVIAYGKWGATETVVDGTTGVFFSPQTPESLNDAIERFENMEWENEKIQEHAEGFSKKKFQDNITKYIEWS